MLCVRLARVDRPTRSDGLSCAKRHAADRLARRKKVVTGLSGTYNHQRRVGLRSLVIRLARPRPSGMSRVPGLELLDGDQAHAPTNGPSRTVAMSHLLL
jgi:hypothetical protein